MLLILACSACNSTGAHSQAPQSGLPSISVASTQTYTVQQNLSLTNKGSLPPEKQNLWVALIQDVPPYQEVLTRKISPKKYILVADEYGNQYAEFDLSDHPPGTVINIEIEYQVRVNEINYNLESCAGDLLDEFIDAELHIESSNPQIIQLGKELSKGKKTPCQQVRAFYDYAGDELIYTYNRDSWGAQAATGLMGSDCTEYASLVIALARAEGIPARYYEGLLYLKGKQEGLAQSEHAWLEAYFPGTGWVALDPTLGRIPANRETNFGHYTADHIIVTVGRNPSTLRGASYWSHLYWPGNITSIKITNSEWIITSIN